MFLLFSIAAAALLGLDLVWRLRGWSIVRCNSEDWYRDLQSPIRRMARWLWSTGMTDPYWTRAGYTYRAQGLDRILLSIRANQDLGWAAGVLRAFTPISLFGHRITVQWFGVTVRWFGTYACLHHKGGSHVPSREWYAYLSDDSTPSQAHVWFYGAPIDIARSANKTAASYTTMREQRERPPAQAVIINAKD